jgi:hypothetical protein
LKTATLIVLLVPVIVGAIVVVPLALIWALNTLFALGIAYTMKTWLAMLLLSAVFSAGSAKRS